MAKGSEDLRDYQRRVMEAREALLAHLDQVFLTTGMSQGRAILALLAAAREGTLLPPELQKLAPLANARAGQGRTLCRATVYNWLSARTAANGAVVAVASKLSRREAPIPEWASTFLRLYGRPQKPNITEVLELWPAHEPKPSYDQARRFLRKLDRLTRDHGRNGREGRHGA